MTGALHRLKNCVGQIKLHIDNKVTVYGLHRIEIGAWKPNVKTPHGALWQEFVQLREQGVLEEQSICNIKAHLSKEEAM